MNRVSSLYPAQEHLLADVPASNALPLLMSAQLAASGKAGGKFRSEQHVLLKTRVQIPVSSAVPVARPRLEERVAQGLTGRLLLVSAPAGSGKTTLLTAWAQSAAATFPVAWISLDEEEHDVVEQVHDIFLLNNCKVKDEGKRKVITTHTRANSTMYLALDVNFKP